MTENTPPLEDWKKLFDLATQVKAAAPWEWMEETEVFGVQHPETGQLGFVSVMGNLGEHLSIALYQGTEGLYKFWEVVDAGPLGIPEKILEVPQLQLSFEDRNDLAPKDKDLIKRLGLKFRGQQSWPLFRSYWPGYFPWYLEAEEARFLIYVLEQLLQVAPRVKENYEILEPTDNEYDYLVRVAHRQGTEWVWQDQVMKCPPPDPKQIALSMDFQALAALKKLPRKDTLQIDLFLIPDPIQEEKEQRPYFAYNLLIVHAKHGFILGSELMHVDPQLEDMWGNVPLTIVSILANASFNPKTIHVRDQLLLGLLQPVAKEMNWDLAQKPHLPFVDDAKGAFLSLFG